MIGTDEIPSADGSAVLAVNTGKRQRNAIRFDLLSRSASLSLRGHCKSQKDNDRPVQAQYILIVQPADPCADLGFWHGGYFVDHKPARGAQTVALVRFDNQTKQRRVGWIAGEGANCDGIGRIEIIVLHDDGRARLPGVISAPGNGPDFSAPHSSPASDAASMNA